MKLLIVDDHRPTRDFLREMFKGAADEIVDCADGLEAVSSFTDLQPDWVVMDIYMKNMTGLAATREIKARFPRARIIVTTGVDHPALRTAALQAGACAFVLKENLYELRQHFESPYVSSPKRDDSEAKQ